MIGTTDIKIGDHITARLFGMTFDLDTIFATVVAGAILLILGFIVRAKVTSRTPSKLQLILESVVNFIDDIVVSNLGHKKSKIGLLAIALFMFILIANWIAVIPSGYPREYLPPPAADINTVLALALVSIFVAHFAGFRKHKLRYFKKLFGNGIGLVEEIPKPLTLALRLFGNIFAGTVMVSILSGILPLVLIPFLVGAWKLFDMFIGLIQAFIFALLTVVYYGIAVEEGH